MGYNFPASPSEGQTYAPGDGLTYVYKAPKWTPGPMATSVGPQGPTGPQGPAGPQGPQGVAGTGINMKGSVATIAALPPGPHADGDAWVVQADGHLHVWDVTTNAFIDVGPMVGPAGPQGVQGIQGPVGPAGPTGATGAVGAAGAVGATGAQGLKGDTGAQGAAGPAGPQGATGLTGATGPQGVKGDTGLTGALGPVGPAGATGATGAQGPIGPAGPGLTDGDKGDIVVSASGASWLFDPTVVTAAAKTVLDDADVGAMRTTLGVAPAVHTHAVADVTGLQTALDGKAAATHTHTTAQVTGLDTALAGKASTAHTHATADVSGLDTALAGKAALAGATFTGASGVNYNVSGSPFSTYNNSSNLTANDGSAGLMVQSTNEPSIAFHRAGAFAWKMGVNASNLFSFGGWSVAKDVVTIDSAGSIVAKGHATIQQTLNVSGASWFAVATLGAGYLGAFADTVYNYLQFAPTYYLSYERSTGHLRWSGAGSENFIFYQAGGIWVKGGATFGGNITTSGSVASSTYVYGTSGVYCGGTHFGFYHEPGSAHYTYYSTYSWSWQWSAATGALNWLIPGAQHTTLRQDGGLLCYYNAAYKPGGGPWGDLSDARIKTVVGEYEHGLDQILALRPVRYLYKGNDTPAEPEHLAHELKRMAEAREVPPELEVPYPNSQHYVPATVKEEFIGLIAQEVESLMPEMVKLEDGFIDGVAVANMRKLDTGPLIFALINSVKTLAANNSALEARLAALEGTR